MTTTEVQWAEMLLLLLEARRSKLLSVEARTLLHRAKALLPKALLIWSAPGLKEGAV
jgi:hypothetical protein